MLLQYVLIVFDFQNVYRFSNREDRGKNEVKSGQRKL